MRSKIISIFIVFLLSISITACSSNKGSLNTINSSNSSSNKTSDSNSRASGNRTPDTNTQAGTSASDSKNGNEEVQAKPQSGNNYAMEAYKAVLKNKTEFFSTDNKKSILLNDFLTKPEVYETTFKVLHFSVLDMDSDGVPEVVLELAVTNDNYPDFYEVLHYTDSKVYGYLFGIRSMEDLKADGTFGYSGGAADNGFGKLIFQDSTCKTNTIGYKESGQTNSDGTINEKYFINNKQVTEETYDSFQNGQTGKKDTVWHEFTGINIDSELSIGS